MPKKTSNFNNIEAAIQSIQNDGMSQKAAAKKFGVARSTLQFRIKNLERDNISCGPSTVLTTHEESILVKWILECCKKGFPRRREDLQNSVKRFLDEQERQTPFINNLPGIGWYKCFLKRHPIISIRTSEHVSNASANVSEHNIKKWFIDIHNYLSEENLADILCDGSRVFNGDETGFSLCPKTKCVLGPKGSKDIYEIAKGNEKENITVMFSFNAVGQICHPMLIFKYERIPKNILDSIPPNWGIRRSDTGWMVSETFYEYISNIFYPFLVASNIKFPVILFVDGHKSHLTYHLSKLCLQLNIILIALYPNATRILQPADVAAFRPIKAGWKKGISDWKNENPNTNVTKNEFVPILNKVLKDTIKTEVLINGFKACGLFPWDVNNIDFKKCLGKNPSTEKTNTVAVINNETNTRTLDYNQFTDIVGPETIEKFRNIKDMISESYSEEFFALYRLYEMFNKNDDTLNNVSYDSNHFLSGNNMPSSHEVINTTTNQSQPPKKSKNDNTPINNSHT